jgi:SAM-dependent methyltransferase
MASAGQVPVRRERDRLDGRTQLMRWLGGELRSGQPLRWAVGYLCKTVKRLRLHGPLGTARLVACGVCDRWARLAERWFDFVGDVDTSGRVLLYRDDGPPESNPQYLDYQPTPVRTVRALLEQLEPYAPASTLVDFGSGKGRVLLLAAQFPFRRVVGVEFDEALHRTACENIARFRGRRRCGDVRSVAGRAETFELPPGDLVLYFFHPFKDEIFERTIENVVRSYREHPRRILLAFLNPVHTEVVDRFTEFRRLAMEPLPFDPVRFSSSYRDSHGRPYDALIFAAD